MHRGFLSYLAHVHNLSKDSFPLETIRMVREFMNVFHKDLPSVPLDSDTDFLIDLESGIKPIFISPYRITPIELKELKDNWSFVEEKVHSA